ncbi:sensor histidine kinase [Niallia sp. NCCP-28]|uniref:sensor histidine kinase n=1 Tax=Niallia sp. NCCP-28 TaxID=2934712 RepID=UPI002086F4B9|nr:sensor histidine kinase [Niallia sp. NCCP-28]GKU84438.1 sensor histidine kinase [Niallia sp. NCCP-28]
MSIVQRQIVWGVSASLVFLLFLSGSYMFVFPPKDWIQLWDKELMGIPFLLFVTTAAIAIGVLFGVATGYSWKKQIDALETSIDHFDGNSKEIHTVSHFLEEISGLVKKIKRLQTQLMEQTKLSQRLVNEQVENQEVRVQTIITQERNRLARELHDSVSQQLFAASMLLSAINETRPKSDNVETKQLKLVEETIHQSQTEMRALLLHLRPAALNGKTLKEGIIELLSELLQKVILDISWELEELQLDKGMEDHLFRILQESVSNTLRHAKAKKLEVRLMKREGFIIMRIVDDGIGFDVEKRKAGSYGLQNMYERAAEIGGKLKIISLAQKGTRLEAKVPLLTNKER